MSVLSFFSSFFHRSGSYDVARAAKANGLVRHPKDVSDAKARADVLTVLQEAETRAGSSATGKAQQLRKKIASLIDHAARNVGRDESAPLPTLQEARELRDQASFDLKVNPGALQSLKDELDELVTLCRGPSFRLRVDLHGKLMALSEEVGRLTALHAPDTAPTRRIAELHESVSGMRVQIETVRNRQGLWAALAPRPTRHTPRQTTQRPTERACAAARDRFVSSTPSPGDPSRSPG